MAVWLLPNPFLPQASSAPLEKYFSKPLMRERRNSVEKVIETQSNGNRKATKPETAPQHIREGRDFPGL